MRLLHINGTICLTSKYKEMQLYTIQGKVHHVWNNSLFDTLTVARLQIKFYGTIRLRWELSCHAAEEYGMK
jgi:hypothetical protein